jgi:anti-sigma factor ChrR (cupin superfamily)
MPLNDDFSQRVVSFAADAVWSHSSVTGIDQRWLEQSAGDIALTSRIDRYAAGTQSESDGLGGEEILVLAGGLSYGPEDYPPGSYLRLPNGHGHAGYSRDGCTLFVKRFLFHPDDQVSLHVDTATAEWHRGLVRGLSVMPLHEHDGISTALVRWAPQTQFTTHAHPGGEEILVLDGVFQDEFGRYPAGTWLRSPRWSRHTPFTGDEGALIYVKVGSVGYR